jgi:hypothetical protein
LALALSSASLAAAQGTPRLPSISGYLQLRESLPRHGGSRFAVRRFKLMARGRLDGLGYYVQGIDKANNDSPTDDHPHRHRLRVQVDVERRDERVEVAGNDAVRIQLQKWFGGR